MEYTSLEIRKIGVDTWIVIPNGIEAGLRGQSKYTGGITANYVTIKTSNGAQEWKNIPYTVISYNDTITPANSRASFASTQAFLIYANQTRFFADGGSGTGTATSFNELTDTPDTKTGSAGKSVVVSDDETQLEYELIPIINSSTDIPDFPQELIEGKYLKVVGGVYTLVDAIEGTQNNIGKKVILGYTDVTPTINLAVSRANEVGFVVSEQETPVLLYFRSITGTFPVKQYNYIFLPGKGTYGTGNTPVTSAMLYPLPVTNVTPEQIEDDPNSVIYNLDPVTDGDFIAKANTTFWDFSDSTYPEDGMNYYFSYTDDGVLYYALFIGTPTPGTYGTGGTPFTEDDFVTTTSNEVDPTIPIDPDNYLKLTGELFQDVEGEVNIQKLTVTQTPTDPQDVTTKTYVDGLTMGLLRLAGNWDASTGTYPTTGTGTGGIVRRGDSYIVTVAGTIYGQVFGIGDSFYSLVNNPAQIPSNWGRFEVPTGQATDVMAGILLLFGTTGTSTIGTMTQKAITDALALKANLLGGNNYTGDQVVDNGLLLNRRTDVNRALTLGARSDGIVYIYASQATDGTPVTLSLQPFNNGKVNIGFMVDQAETFAVNGTAFINNTLTLKSPTGISPKVLVIQNLSGTEISSISGSGGMVIGSVTASGSITALNIVSSSNVVIPNAPVNGTDGTNKTYVDSVTANLPNAILQNGNSFGATMLIGTNDAFVVNIKTNGVTRVNISDAATSFNTPITLSEILSSANSTFGRITMGISSAPTIIKRTAGNIAALKVSYSVSAGTGEIIQYESNSGSGDVIVAGVRKDGRTYGSNGTATNDYVTKQQLDTVANVTKTGTNTQSGNGTATSFSIPHGLGTTPTYWNAVAISAAAGNISYVTANSTNIIVFYSVAPASGTNNLSWNWIAR